MNNLVRRSFRSTVPGFSRDVTDLVERFFSDPLFRFSENKDATSLFDWQPRINLKETDKEYTVVAELPGLTAEQVDVTVENNALYLKGEKKFEHKEEKENYHRIEMGYGSFFRTVEFPGKINSGKVTADLKHGVLTVTVGKANEVLNSARKISVKSI